ncbi:MAG: phytoene desaturase family protein [Clostridium sp.]|uniref:phytoene desaturase family protein n=1 Tax=Clostridium sp. TaxID=1506 RepID=UPI003EE669B5
MKTAIVIGAGISGLSSALRLQSKGYSVTILEKNNFIGGKTCLIKNNFSTFNLTATIPMLFECYEELFKDIGENIFDYINILNFDSTFKAFFTESKSITFHTSLINLSRDFTNDDFEEYLDIVIDAKNKYSRLQDNFLKVPSLSLRKLSSLSFLHPLKSSYSYFKNNLSNSNLINALAFQSMFIGMSPFESSSIFSILPLINITKGLVNIYGGISSFVKGLHKVFLKRGGNIILNSEVTKLTFTKNTCTGVLLKDSTILNSDVTFLCCDFPYALKNLLPYKLTKKTFPFSQYEKDDLTIGTFILYLSIKKDFKNLNTHNILINKDFSTNIKELFNGKLSKNPSLYIYKDSINNDITNLNILMRVPNLFYLNETFWNNSNITKLNNLIITTLEDFFKMRGLSSLIISSRNFTPLSLRNSFNSYGGASYGLMPTLSKLDFLRPQSSIKNINSLYFAGDSIHPGAGISNVLISSKIAVNTFMHDLEKK